MVETDARPRNRRFLVVTLALLLFTLLTAGVAIAALPTQKGPASPASPNGGCCGNELYYQGDYADGTFTDSYTDTKGYESQAADDFIVPAGESWAVYQVGFLLNTCCDDDLTIYFYSNAVSGTQNIPGALVYSQTFEYDSSVQPGSSPSGTCCLSTFGDSGRAMLVLPAGHYWLSIQGSNWPLEWRNRTVTSNSPAAWRNPGVVMSAPEGNPGCTDWGTRSTDCGLNPQAPDQNFSVYGFADRNLPTPVVEACGLNWRVVPSENYTGTDTAEVRGFSMLSGVAAVSETDAWSVGTWFTGSNSGPLAPSSRSSAPQSPNGGIPFYQSGHPLIERWDGESWVVYPSPPLATTEDNREVLADLNDVDEVSADEVWAVGRYLTETDGCIRCGAPELGPPTANQTLIMNYDGSGWSVVDSPNNLYSKAGITDNTLNAVDAESSTEAWAVGYYYAGSDQTLVMRWDGTEWTIVESPNYTPTNEQVCCTGNYLLGVSAVPDSDQVWAVGRYYRAGEDPTRPLTMRYDGTEWQLVENPFTNSDPNANSYMQLNDVYALAEDDVWAVGTQSLGPPSNFDFRTLIMHWDGEEWTEVEAPNRSTTNELMGIHAISADDIWAVGYYGSSSLVDAPQGTNTSPLTLHWDGEEWTDVSNPQLEYTERDLFLDVDGVATDDVLAVGYSDFNQNEWSNDTTLAEQYSDPCAGEATGTTTATASTTATGTTTSLPTGTATSTTTPLPTSTPCNIQFPDVPPGSTFYSFVRCLVCRGFISGFPDGTYKPSANVTRGQLAKIVSNTAGFNDSIPTNRRTFADVPYSTDVSSYWVFVERLFAHGVIDGYECGGTNSQTGQEEPCDSENRNYFRPGNYVTRGQASKIVSEAAGYDEDIPNNQQTYEDVPPTGEGSTFWEFIQRLSNRGVMSGYECGEDPAGPCQSGNRAYFLPNDTLSRGQAAKIVANTFYPNCETPARP